MKQTTALILPFFLCMAFCATAAPTPAKPALLQFPEVAKQLEQLRKLEGFVNSKESIELKEKLSRQSNTGLDLIQAAQEAFEAALANIDPSDPRALIQLQILAFQFTNTVQSVSASLSSIASATQSAAQKIGS